MSESGYSETLDCPACGKPCTTIPPYRPNSRQPVLASERLHGDCGAAPWNSRSLGGLSRWTVQVMRKGLHIIRALFPELEFVVCLWCGGSLRCGAWIGTYEPRLAKPQAGPARLCWHCALKCSELEGQPTVPLHFAAQRWEWDPLAR
jgi:hypothetical protein